MDPRIPDPFKMNLIEALTNTVKHVPEHTITIYDRRGLNPERRTYGQLETRMRLTAGRLATMGIGPGDRLLICLSTSWDLIDIYLAAIYRGAYPVLVAPTGALGGAAAHAKKLAGLVEQLKPKLLLCDDSTRKELVEFEATAANALSKTHTEISALTPVEGVTPHPAKPNDIAFLQLTSGSTSRQRAVKIRHSNVIHNSLAISSFARATPFDSHESIAAWLPLNHDMGLVGCFFFSIVNGFNLFLMRPESFLARPKMWLQILSDTKSTMVGAPNFAYQLCVERIEPEEVAGLDLSHWRIAMTGAEMVHPQTCKAFSEKFAPQKLSPSTMIPCYGLAEGTLAVTADLKQRGIRTISTAGMEDAGLNLSEVVCVGEPIIDTEVRIAAPGSAGKFIADGKIGEVWVRGPSVFAGYYNDEEATNEALKYGWLCTGDLGFMKNGELYITGRIKELLIIHGHNLMPHELEWVAENVSGGGGSERCGAFSVTKGEGEHAVLVVEVGTNDPAELGRMDHEIRSRLGRALGLPLSDLVFIKRGQMPKTTSGKVQRRELRQRYLDGRLERLAVSPPPAKN